MTDYTITDFEVGDKAVLLDHYSVDEQERKRVRAEHNKGPNIKFNEDPHSKTEPNECFECHMAGVKYINLYGKVINVEPFNYIDGTPGTTIWLLCANGKKIGTFIRDKIRRPTILELITQTFEPPQIK